jgi:hypothetical protein
VTFLFEMGDCARTKSVRRAADTPTEQRLFRAFLVAQMSISTGIPDGIQ